MAEILEFKEKKKKSTQKFMLVMIVDGEDQESYVSNENLGYLVNAKSVKRGINILKAYNPDILL